MFYLERTRQEWCGTPGALAAEAIAEYRRCFDPATISASCEDYRAGATVDLADDAADAQRIGCPVLVLWSAQGLGSSYDVLAPVDDEHVQQNRLSRRFALPPTIRADQPQASPADSSYRMPSWLARASASTRLRALSFSSARCR